MNLDFPKQLASRLRGLGNGRRSAGFALKPERVRDLTRRLEQERRNLEGFTASMEQEFLELGSLLRQIAALARDITSRSSGIIDAAAGRTEDAAIHFAFQLLKKAEDLVYATREQYGGVFQVFERMHVDLTRIARERHSLMRTLSPLDSINTQFRVQACAFDENTRSQFFVLAGTIGGLVRDVQSAVGQRFEELDCAGRAAGELIEKLAALAAEQEAETERMLAETRAHLSNLNEALQSSERAALAISASGTNIAGGVASAIVALQCQDMARQKFQHIGAAINEMIGHLAPGAVKGFHAAEESDCRHFLADAGRVQLSQLHAVFEQLAQAGGQVGTGLADLESETKSLADSAVQAGGATLEGEIIERVVASIESVLSVIDKAVSSVRSVVDLVVKLKATFSDCTSQILGLALRLRMVALNAQIFAAHVDAGVALEVVARNTRQVADESMQQLDEISSRVAGLVDSVMDLEQRLADYSELALIEQKLLADEAGESKEKLRALERNLREAMAGIGPLETNLTDAIQRAIGSIRFPAAVAQASERSTGLFQQIVDQYSDLRGAHHKVQELKRNYTMAHERSVHESVVAEQDNQVSAENGSASAAPLAAEGADDKIAGNVELF